MVSYLKGPAPPACDILLLSNQHTGVAAAEFAGIAYDDVISGPSSAVWEFHWVLFSLRLALVHVLQLHRVCKLSSRKQEAV